jgi:hypothetical protein
MYRQLQELKEADPFKHFYITMSDGKEHKLLKPDDLDFAVSGLPQIKRHGGRWSILNPDHIVAILVGLKPQNFMNDCQRCRIPPRQHAFVFPEISFVHYEVWCKKCGAYECTDVPGESKLNVISRWNRAQATSYVRPQIWFCSPRKKAATS